MYPWAKTSSCIKEGEGLRQPSVPMEGDPGRAGPSDLVTLRRGRASRHTCIQVTMEPHVHACHMHVTCIQVTMEPHVHRSLWSLTYMHVTCMLHVYRSLWSLMYIHVTCMLHVHRSLWSIMYMHVTCMSNIQGHHGVMLDIASICTCMPHACKRTYMLHTCYMYIASICTCMPHACRCTYMLHTCYMYIASICTCKSHACQMYVHIHHRVLAITCGLHACTYVHTHSSPGLHICRQLEVYVTWDTRLQRYLTS